MISLNGVAEVTIEAGTNFEDAGTSWTDIVDGNGTLTAQGEVNTLVPGVYVLLRLHRCCWQPVGDKAYKNSRGKGQLLVIELVGRTRMSIEAGSPYVDEGQCGRISWTAMVL